MAAINEDTRDAWQSIANEVSKQRPYPGREVRVLKGRKHKGKQGTVVRHEADRFTHGPAFRYGGEASQHVTAMRGRYGFAVLVQPDDGAARFWVRADYVTCTDALAGETVGEDPEAAPAVCPGCQAVNEPCAPGCVDAAIAAERDQRAEDNGCP